MDIASPIGLTVSRGGTECTKVLISESKIDFIVTIFKLFEIVNAIIRVFFLIGADFRLSPFHL